MPLYEYKCRKCGHRFEKIEGVSASEIKKCPECGAKAERMLSAPAIQFKGTGWYVTDYGGKNSDSLSKDPKDTKEAAEAAKSGEKPPEKPAEKTAAKNSSKEPAKKMKAK
ncbi:MAG: zinc ribbon domain-containing protein [Candidatus Acidiferrales bacterium]